MAILEVKQLTKKFDDIDVLKGIDLNIEKGEVIAIIGSSGSGKTTLLRCLNFLETADSGSIILDGHEVFNSEKNIIATSKGKGNIRLPIGMVFQSFNLFPQYNVKENISLALKIHKNNDIRREYKNKLLKLKEEKLSLKEKLLKRKELIISREKEIKEAINEISDITMDLLKEIGLEDKALAYPEQLSGGQCQRVAIARALALKPKILCFDEPTSALDPELTNEVLRVIKSLKSKDRAMIIVTHEMNFARNVADRIIFMADGKVELIDKAKTFFANTNDKLNKFLANVNIEV